MSYRMCASPSPSRRIQRMIQDHEYGWIWMDGMDGGQRHTHDDMFKQQKWGTNMSYRCEASDALQ